MLWDISTLTGYAIEAQDGSIGSVSDWLFDDDRWTIRWLVVDTGHWLPGRKVLLPLSALGVPDAALRQLPVRLTKQQVKASPDIETDQPVSRQMEAGVFDYYALEPYWGAGYVTMSNAMAAPIVKPVHIAGTEPRDYIATDLPPHNSNPHLRSSREVIGYHIHAIDGMIGHIEDFIVDDATWIIAYIKVDTKNWWPGARILMPTGAVQELDWAARSMNVNVTRQFVKDSPPFNPMATVDGAYGQSLLKYYEMGGLYM